MKIWQDSLNEKDSQITQLRIKNQDVKSKCEALEVANEALKKTLKETQNELVGLVEAHEQLSQKQSVQCQDVLLLTAEINQYKTEIAEKTALIKEY